MVCHQFIRVWSTRKVSNGLISNRKIPNTYVFWQAERESEKTSIRTRTRLGRCWGRPYKGGNAVTGMNWLRWSAKQKKHELYDLAVNEDEAAVVRIIFDKYVSEGYGTQRIATHLNAFGYRARTGKMWHHASIRGIICNLSYTGVAEWWKSFPDFAHLQIVSPEVFQEAQNIRTSRANSVEDNRTVLLNTRGQSLLAGNVFCGHCGSRLTLTTNGKYRRRQDGSMDTTQRVRYVCYGKTRKQTECDGQTGLQGLFLTISS